jgi:hypothetical protein
MGRLSCAAYRTNRRFRLSSSSIIIPSSTPFGTSGIRVSARSLRLPSTASRRLSMSASRRSRSAVSSEYLALCSVCVQPGTSCACDAITISIMMRKNLITNPSIRNRTRRTDQQLRNLRELICNCSKTPRRARSVKGRLAALDEFTSRLVGRRLEVGFAWRRNASGQKVWGFGPLV